MKRLTLFSAVVLVLALAPLAPHLLTAQAPTASPIARYMMDVYADGTVRLSTLTHTPWPTYTPEATNTSVQTPTATPSPSATATHTPTRTPTAPPTVASATPEPTPTVEQTPLPTITPGPTSVPKVCNLRAGGVLETNLRIRSGPGTEYGQVGTWTLGTESDLVEFAYDARGIYLWARHGAGGWSAVYDVGILSWYADGTQAAALCTLVEGWPEGLEPPATIARAILQGAHVIGADGANVLLNYCRDMTTVKLFETVIHYADDFHACNPDMWIVCRYWTDDIAIDTDYNAQEAYNRIGDKFPSDCDAVEWENEKAPNNNRDWERWSAFSIEAARLMATRRNMQYCAFGLGPGWPDFDKLQYMIEYLKWVDANPLPDGRYHCVSSHAAMFAPWNRSDMPWVNDPYIAGRVYLIRDYIYEITPDDFDLYEWRGVWAITEVGLSDGYSGNWSAPYTCEELRQAYWTTHETYKAHGLPHAQHHWSFGPGGIWTDDSRCAGEIWG